MRRILTLCYVLIWTAPVTKAEDIVLLKQNEVSLRLSPEQGRLGLTVSDGETIKLKGKIGVRASEPFTPCDGGVKNCFMVGDGMLQVSTHLDYGFTIHWSTNNTRTEFEDCFDLDPFHWYGGPEQIMQFWPIEKLTLINFANVLQENQHGAVIEPYWLNSAGAFIFVDHKVPLFISQNGDESERKVCFSAKVTSPYPPTRKRVTLAYTIGIKENVREAHLHAVKDFLGKPTGHPNYKIIERPIWSTWARYKRDVNDEVLRAFAKEIADNGYTNGQFEIDDDWEDCYGALTFRSSKFANISKTVDYIKSFNFTVSLWVHPFINTDCVGHLSVARDRGYLVKNFEGSDLTRWWNSAGGKATHLDFTKLEVREWFAGRLKSLQKNYGIDSFKFDAGETSWAPTISQLQGDEETMPNVLSEDYLRMCAEFGDLIEVRSGWRTQDLPIFVRMLDRDSHWTLFNGLHSLITTLLQMNMNGYTMVLPDLIGGNGYHNQKPSAELFVRWLQANTFMPSIQFSFVPWDFTETKFSVTEISRKFIDLHQKYAPHIKTQMERSIKEGHPVNAPIWWISPNDTIALTIDSEFLLGEDILVAPVIKEGATSRDVYLPAGEWVDGNNGSTYKGPIELKNYPAPIDVLPYFIRNSGSANLVNVITILFMITVTYVGIPV
ncbi:hypothetical protein PPYR_06721 [Photinus pyralis]|uniref:Glycoside hydrolase family 31 N-terminal domain-containing protein n=2 Tax=Photinus pyralis TaxID=7054 RepID=A0A5N4ANF8_PHOPY|nr:myogenesis-regulating glycosidase-like isoform X1 [Photinus pyralis]XP_031341540.1 myogenesis-regulating glycosidase-like isoform X1 [Photinus pyralis]KAB0798841.1 hypothetical protein PPYR_06721 [Photinus pyralis]